MNRQIQQNQSLINQRFKVDKSLYCIEICGGYCCLNLTLSYSPEELKLLKSIDGTIFSEIFKFVSVISVNNAQRYKYQCKLFKDDKCSIYENRPDMCKGFGEEYKAEDAVFCIYSDKFDTDYLTSKGRLKFD
uniref:Putative zinc-or iron-chelating protein n=1 Tax=viral metagenome TaxID=1070528 RepID=A0A6M3IL26_9ZZZZ